MLFRKISLIVLVAGLLAPVARADEPASKPTSTSAQTPVSAAQSKPASDAKKSNQPTSKSASAKNLEAQKLKQVVVTATKIEQPVAEVGTTVTVVDDSQIEAQKIGRVENVLREVPGVTVTQSGSPGSVTDVSIRGANSSQTLVLVDGVEVNAGATGGFDISNLTTDNLDRLEVLRGAGE